MIEVYPQSFLRANERKMNSNYSFNGGGAMEILTFKLDLDGIFHMDILVEKHSRKREQQHE